MQLRGMMIPRRGNLRNILQCRKVMESSWIWRRNRSQHRHKSQHRNRSQHTFFVSRHLFHGIYFTADHLTPTSGQFRPVPQEYQSFAARHFPLCFYLDVFGISNPLWGVYKLVLLSQCFFWSAQWHLYVQLGFSFSIPTVLTRKSIRVDQEFIPIFDATVYYLLVVGSDYFLFLILLLLKVKDWQSRHMECLELKKLGKLET